MVVGIDAHKRSHTAVLLDEHGAPLAMLSFANGEKGFSQLRAWLAETGAGGLLIGVENAGGYARSLCQNLVQAGHEVLNVPAWRVRRERVHRGPGKSDPADAVAVGLAVLHHAGELGPALEPPLIQALALLETHRRQAVYRRTEAVQQLRAMWGQFDPGAEGSVGNIAATRVLTRLKVVDLGTGVAERVATRCIRQLAAEIESLNEHLEELDLELAAFLEEHGDPFAHLPGVGVTTAATLIAQSGDVRRFPNEAAYARYGGTAPIPCGSGERAERHRLHRGGNRQVNAALHRIAVTQARVDPRARAYLARKTAEGKTKREARRALKRHLSNVVYRRLLAWAQSTIPDPY
jgi:transposase